MVLIFDYNKEIVYSPIHLLHKAITIISTETKHNNNININTAIVSLYSKVKKSDLEGLMELGATAAVQPA